MAFANKMREQLAQSFVEALNQDRIPWQACWQLSQPENAITGRRYQSTNALLLSYVASQKQFLDSRWCTFNQAKDKGWHIQKGAKGCPVEYWAYYDREEKKMLPWPDAKKIIRQNPEYAERNLVLRSRTFTVFNAQQIEGIPERTQHPEMNIDEFRHHRDTLLHNMNLRLLEGFSDPSYSPLSDTIFLPYEKDFFDTYSYACTMLHEAGHATGHESRLNRDLTGSFGSESYAKEELRAEIASAFTAQSLGLHLTNKQLAHHMNLHKAYIQSWAAVVQNNPEELFHAIKDAEKISDYLMEKGEFSVSKGMEPTTPEPAAEVPRSGPDNRTLDSIVAGAVAKAPPEQSLTLEEQIARAKQRAEQDRQNRPKVHRDYEIEF